MFIIGLVLFFLIGITLGLIGTGGGILAVPILVYIFKIEKIEATVYSLFIISTTALIGSIQYIKQRLIRLDVLITFALPSIIGIFISRHFILPSLPQNLFTIGHFLLQKGGLIMILFALIMLVSAITMLKGNTYKTTDTSPKIVQTIVLGLLTGLLVGFVGAGGGIIIVPILVLFMAVEMKQAVGNSLFIIFINSAIGFISDSHSKSSLNWGMIIGFTLAAIAGILVGLILSKKISNQKLKKAFGIFVLAVGAFVLYSEFVGMMQ
jgi:uncharacterized membrane protein YfcA